MATGVSNFSISSSGNNINYTITWEGFGCSGSSQITIRLWDINRNAVTVSAVFTSVGTTGTITGTFTSIYAGLFRANAIFMCDGNRVAAFQTLDITHGSTIDPPPPATEPPPVAPPTPGVTPPSDPGFDYCIPATGAVSMGDLNVVFGRDRNLVNTLLSGTSNPSISPSLFGVSFLPNNVVSPGKLTPNAISEFRGYCHVAPIINPTVDWSFVTNNLGTGQISINYTNTSGSGTAVIQPLTNPSSPESASGSFIAKAGNFVSVAISNFSVNPNNTTLIVLRNQAEIYNDPGFGSLGNSFSFIADSGATYEIISEANTNSPLE